MVERKLYMQQIKPYMNKEFVKVLTGIRRCGKSTILMLVREELEKSGIEEEQMIYINFDNLDFSDLDSAKKLYKYLKERMKKNQRYYILLDEIQEVSDWEKVVNSLLTRESTEQIIPDIYITGSNSHMLSSELATYIAGRYIEIKVNPLSFKEFLQFKEIYQKCKIEDPRKELENYIRLGGFPVVHTGEYSQEQAYRIIYDIYSSALLRDTVQRHNIRNIELLERIVKFVFDNVGNTFSAKKVADYFKSQQRKVDLNTVYNYLSALESAFIIKRIPRYDIKGKEILQTNEKYFVGDQSLIYSVMGYKDRIISGILENIVLLELERRGYQVYIGKLDTKEVDFIAEKRNQKVYVQVSYTPSDSEETMEREFAPLMAIQDNYPKYIVTMDHFFKDNIEGIQYIYLADFLLKEEY